MRSKFTFWRVFFVGLFILSLIVIFSIFTRTQVQHFLEGNPALIFVSIGPVIAWLSLRSQRHLTKAKYTVDFQASFSDSDAMKKAAKTFKKHFKHMSSAELVELASGENVSKKHDQIVQILNAWERVAVALKHDVYDEEMLYDVYGSFLLNTCFILGPYIRHKQSTNPKVFMNLQLLYIRWRVRRDRFDSDAERQSAKSEYRALFRRANNRK